MPRLLHVGLGPLGRRVLGDALAADLELVGVVDVDPELQGRPLSELVPGAPADLRVRGDLEGALRELRPTAALLTTSSDLERCMDSLRPLVSAGVAVVSSCEELLWPWLRHPVLAQELHERGVRSGGRVVGTGINPGFLMDTLPLAASAVCLDVRHVLVERIQDATPRRLPFQRKIGATLSPADFQAAAEAGTLRHVGLGESLHFLAASLRLAIDEWSESLEPVLAEEPMQCALGPIPAGHATGVRQVAVGLFGGRERLRLVFQAAIGQADPHDGVRIDGDPPVDLVLHGGVHGDVGTSAMLLNTLPALLEAQPGLHTMASLRPAHARARSSSGT